METKKRYVNWNQVWLLLGAVTIPLALVVLFQLLRGRQALMNGWVFAVSYTHLTLPTSVFV